MRRILHWVLILAIPLAALAQQRGAQRGTRGGAPGAPVNPAPSNGTPAARGRGNAGTDQPARPPVSANGGTVEGTVFRADTNETLSRARIDIVRADWAPPAPARQLDPRAGAAPRQPAAVRPPMLTANTDEQGRFSFSNVAPGRYRLSAARNQFVRMDYGQRGRNELGTLVVVERGGRTEGIVLRLFPAPTLAGTVIDASGQPMAAATIAAYRLEYTTSGRKLSLAKAALTDDRGQYRLFWLSPGDYYLVAGYGEQLAKPMMEGVTLTPNLPPTDSAYTVVYYPGSPNVADAEVVRLAAGLDSVRDIHFRDTPLYKVGGRVVDAASGQPIGRASVVLLLGNGHSGGPTPEPILTDTNGAFAIPGVAPGTYLAYAFVEARPQPVTTRLDPRRQAPTVMASRMYSELQRVIVGVADVNGLVFRLAPATRITGGIQFEGTLMGQAETPDGGQPARELEGNVVSLSRLDGGMEEPRSSALLADATFTIQEAPPGIFEVNAPVPAAFYIKSIRFSGADALSAGIAIRSGTPAGTLSIVLGPGASMDGRILDRNTPVGGAQVVLVPDPSSNSARSPDRYKIVSTDSTGAFFMRGIAPGHYLAFAFEELEAKAYYDPQFLNRIGTRGVPVQFEENSMARPDLQLIPASETYGWNP